jgi:hypothetical protein
MYGLLCSNLETGLLTSVIFGQAQHQSTQLRNRLPNHARAQGFKTITHPQYLAEQLARLFVEYFGGLKFNKAISEFIPATGSSGG